MAVPNGLVQRDLAMLRDVQHRPANVFLLDRLSVEVRRLTQERCAILRDELNEHRESKAGTSARRVNLMREF